jgi:hypothetical protein
MLGLDAGSPQADRLGERPAVLPETVPPLVVPSEVLVLSAECYRGYPSCLPGTLGAGTPTPSRCQ